MLKIMLKITMIIIGNVYISHISSQQRLFLKLFLRFFYTVILVHMPFPQQDAKPDFWEIQQDILKFWKENKLFEQSVESRPTDKPYRFYDGPPFPTGTPHYGTLLSSICKDVIPRFQTMKGKRVERVWWWDCHGIYVEQKVQTKLNLESKDIEKYGIQKFIEWCYSYNKGNIDEWKWYIDNIGRWVDMDNDYKTQDNSYMESVLWVFKQLWEKGLIYEGKRVSLYSTKLSTPISNFEVAMDNTYEEINDPAITVVFDLSENWWDWKNTSVLAWTTTPWTIPCNMALGVHKDIDYVKISFNGEFYIIARNRVDYLFKWKEYAIEDEFKGDKLIGLSYAPPYDYFKNTTWNKNDHKIYFADFATDTDGTWIVHEAPEFGDVDFQLAKKEGITISEAMDENGKYTEQVGEKIWMFYRDANSIVIQELQEMWKLLDKKSITHKVAFCPRSWVPLVYKAQKSRFINIQNIKEDLLAKNEEINRFPPHIKHWRFAKSIENAPDRCISRTRFWGTPMPIRRNEEDVDEMVVIGSREELYELNKYFGQIEKVIEDEQTRYLITETWEELNLHRPWIDSIKIKNPKTGNTLTRITEVLDPWMDSASMPYAQVHYPFQNKQKFEASFPADYIAEYTGQIRAWFYVMHVIWVSLFDKPAYTNVVCTGVMWWNDGRKMSKSYGNYPDPKISFKKYGGDCIRMNIINSPVVYGGDTAIKEEWFLETTKSVLLPLWNTLYFFVTYANIDQRSPQDNIKQKDNFLDQWILSELQKLIKDVDYELSLYNMQGAARPIVIFLDNLTNWYIRRSRRRFWKSENDDDKIQAYSTLHHVLIKLAQICAPFMPFISEYIFRTLTEEISVHLTNFPSPDTNIINFELEESMNKVQKIVSSGLSRRSKKSIRVRQPLNSVTIGFELEERFKSIIADELNVKSVITDTTINDQVKKIIKPDAKILGPKYGKDIQTIIKEWKNGNYKELEDGKFKIVNWIIHPGEYEIDYIKTSDTLDIEVEDGMVIAMDGDITPELLVEGYARDLVRFIQEARKEAGYDIADRIQLSIINISGDVSDIVEQFGDYIQQETLSTISTSSTLQNFDLEKTVEIGEEEFKIALKHVPQS